MSIEEVEHSSFVRRARIRAYYEKELVSVRDKVLVLEDALSSCEDEGLTEALDKAAGYLERAVQVYYFKSRQGKRFFQLQAERH